MQLRASMVKIIWDFENVKNYIPDRGYIYKVSRIEEVKNPKENEVLGVEKEGLDWVTFTHYRVQEEDKKIRQIAFKIEECAWFDDHINEKVTMELYSKFEDDIGTVYLEYDENSGYWFEPTYYNLENGKPSLNDEAKLSPAGIMGAGWFRIKVKSTDGKHEHLSPKINVLPSAISVQHYDEMIKELLFVRDDLIISKDSKVSVNTTQEYLLYEINKALKELEVYLKRINKAPKVSLIKEWEKKSNHSIKNMSSKTLREKMLKPYSNKFIVPVHKEILDMYENQVIKYSLYTLKNKVDFYKKHYLILEENKYREYKKELNDAYVTYEWDKDKLSSYTNEIKSKISLKKGVIDNFIRNIDYFENMKFHDTYNRTKLVEIVLRGSAPFKKYSSHLYKEGVVTNIETCGFENGRYDIEITEFSIGNIKKLPNGKKVKITLMNNNLSQHIFLLESLYNGGKIHIKANYDNLPRDVENQSGYRDYIFELSNIISINNRNCNDLGKEHLIEGSLKWLSNKQVKEAKNLIISEEEKIGFLKIIEDKSKKLDVIAEDIKTKIEEWNRCSLKIENLLNIEFIKATALKPVAFKSSQIFANDKSYSLVWKRLMKLKENNLIYDSLGTKTVFVRDTQNIYEYWCLFKMVHLLVKVQGWKLKNSKNIIQELNKYLARKGNCEIEGFSVKLEHNLKKFLECENSNIELEILFNWEFATNTGGHKTPDFTFKFGGENHNSYVYMDAKYRNYDEQGKKQWLKDIQNVAIKKYIDAFENTNHRTTASFIIHSDGKSDDLINYGGLSIDGIIYNGVANHRYGAIVLLPGKSSSFLMIIKMVLEYHFKLYWTCWNCGEHENISINEKKTEAGYSKYHCTCGNCGEFWVRTHCNNKGLFKLTKHLKNYHSTMHDNPWYVYCPGGCD